MSVNPRGSQAPETPQGYSGCCRGKQELASMEEPDADSEGPRIKTLRRHAQATLPGPAQFSSWIARSNRLRGLRGKIRRPAFRTRQDSRWVEIERRHQRALWHQCSADPL